MEYGKLPPQNLDAEEAVLGALLIAKGAIYRIADFLPAEAFYKEENKVVYQAILDLFNNREPIDILTVCTQLKKNGTLEVAGGSFSVSKLTNRIATDSNIETHATYIAEEYYKREVIRISSQAISEAYETGSDIFKILSQLNNNLADIIQLKSSDFGAKSRMMETYKHILEAMQSKTGITGVPYPWKTVNEWTAGMQKGEVIVIAGPPGSFKTGIAMNITKHLDDIPDSIPSLIFQQEMTNIQTGIREIAMESKIPNTKLKSGNLDDYERKQLDQAINKIENSKVFVDSSAGLTIPRLRSVATKMVQSFGVRVIVIDYLQLMNHLKQKGETDTTAIERTTRELKTISKDLKITIIALSQLLKEANKDPFKIPDLGMLRGSGSIEQDADIIYMLWNPGKYDPNFQFEHNRQTVDARGKIFMVPLKFRDGEPGTLLQLNSYPSINTFVELHDQYSASGGLANDTSFEAKKDDPF